MRFITYLATLLFAVILSACGGGGGSPGLPSVTKTPLTTTAAASLTLAVGATQSFAITGGNAPYRISSSNEQVSVAAVSGSNFTITGVVTGAATITISDASQQTVAIAVTVSNVVALYSTAPTTVSLSPSTSASYTVGGGVPAYSVNSTDSRVVSVSIQGSTLSVNALAIGAATVTIQDAAGKSIQFSVTVGNLIALYSTAPASFTIAKDKSRTFVVGGGLPGYSVISADERIVTASLTGPSLVVTGVAVGTTTLLVRDTVNAFVTLSVTVGGDSPLGLYTSAPATLTIAKGTQSNYSVGGGVAGYSATSGDSRVATVALSGNTMSVNAVAMGSTSISIRDAAGATLSIAVTVASSSPETFFTTAPSSLSMGTGTSLPFSVSGGAQPYSVVSTDARVAFGSISGSTLTIAALKAGTATIQLVDGIGAILQIVVTVDGTSTSGGPASIDIQASGSTLASAPGSKISFVVTVKDAVNTAIPKQVVTFTATSGTLTGASPAPSTDANGTITTISLSPGADASNRTITVTATAGAVSKSINIPVVGTTVSISGAGSALVGTSALTYSVKALDSGGKPIVGAALAVTSSKGNTITPATVTTDVSGSGIFSFTPVVAGTDTLTATGLGTSAITTVAVSNEDFSFTAPLAAANLVVNTGNTVTVRYKVAGVGVAGKTVTFSTTRGSLSATTATTDGSGDASTTVNSSTAGPVTLNAQLDSARSSVTAAFIAITPATIVLQANPGAVLPNATGTTTNQSTLTATVRDATGNPVSGQVVNFTATQDGSNGAIVPGSGTTDANGMTSVQFIPGALSTAANGVVVKATVQSNPSLTSTATLTVNGNALFISIGVASTLNPLDAATYQKQFSVYVTDANGAPAANRAVTLSAFPPTYLKGYLVWDNTNTTWKYFVSASSPNSCANEDLNRNGILDLSPTTEDINGNGRLDPGLPVVITPSTVTTDASGSATFYMNFGKNYAWWLSTQITARASVGGTESSKIANYALEMLAADATSKSSPANQTSPFGIATDCTNPN